MTPLKRFVAFCLALTLYAHVGNAHAERKIATVDSQRAITECEEGLRVQATLKKLFDARQIELDRRQNALQKEREQLEKQRATLAPDVLQKRVEKWQQEAVNVQQTFTEYNRELQRKQGELLQPIKQRLVQIMSQLAKAEGFDMIIDRQTVLFVTVDLDLTERAIKRLNESAAPKK